MFRLFALLSALFFAMTANAEPNTNRIDQVLMYHATVSSGAAVVAVPTVNLGTQLQGWRLCADNGNSGSVLVGVASDSSDARLLGPNTCFDCTAVAGSTCTKNSLGSLKAKGSAPSQGYSVVQFR